MNGPSRADRLTARQREVLTLLCQGRSNETIAAALAISVNTVKAHIGAILRTLGAKSRTHALVIVRQGGVGPIDACGPATPDSAPAPVP